MVTLQKGILTLEIPNPNTLMRTLDQILCLKIFRIHFQMIKKIEFPFCIISITLHHRPAFPPWASIELQQAWASSNSIFQFVPFLYRPVTKGCRFNEGYTPDLVIDIVFNIFILDISWDSRSYTKYDIPIS